MPRSYDDVSTVRIPSDSASATWARGVEDHIETAWRKVQNQPFPTRALSWNSHDRDAQQIVGQYNTYLAASPGYQSLDWHLVKAILFVETNPDHKEWEKSPMQSANPGDSGLSELTSGLNKEKMNLIVPPALRSNLSSANSSAADNITAGVGYLLFEAAQFGTKTGVTDPTVKTITAGRNDDLSSLAKSAATTQAILETLNPSVNRYNLKPGMVLKYQKAGHVTTIIGWTSIGASSVYGLYNRNRRLKRTYPEELNFAYDLIRRNKFLQ